MVYIKNWTEFETAATALYAKSPNSVRYCVKFKPRTGKLVLKITDDTTCIMYKTFSSIILNRFETLNLRLLSQIANLPRHTISSTTASSSFLAPPTGQPGRAGTPSGEEDEGRERAGTPAPDVAAGGKGGSGVAGGGATGTPGGGAGGKKKKKGKR